MGGRGPTYRYDPDLLKVIPHKPKSTCRRTIITPFGNEICLGACPLEVNACDYDDAVIGVIDDDLMVSKMAEIDDNGIAA